MKKFVQSVITILMIIVLMVGLSSCRKEGPLEKAGEPIEKAGENVPNAVKDTKK